jgi:hypothetical protein
MYEQSEPWGFLHCWTILRDEPKWSDRMIEINTGTATRVNQKMAGNTSEQPAPSGQVDNSEGRPEGRDTVKKKRSQGVVDTSSSSTAIEFLQHIHERGEKKDEKEETQMEQILQRKDAKIVLQENLISLQREDMEKRWEIEKEKLILSREEVQMRKEKTQVEMMKAEAHFMGQDLEKLAPHLREYYIRMQRDIMEHHGIIPPPDGRS